MKKIGLILLFVSLTLVGWNQNIQNNGVQNNSIKKNTATEEILLKDTLIDKVKELEEVPVERKDVKPSAKKEVSYDNYMQPEGRAKSVATPPSQAQFQQVKTTSSSLYEQSRTDRTKRSLTPSEQELLTRNSTLLSTIQPESYDANFYTYLAHRFDPLYEKQLQKAASLAPTNNEVKQELFAFALANERKLLADSLFQVYATTESEFTQTYTNNILDALPHGSTLLVHGYSELLALHRHKGLLEKENITLISMDLLAAPQVQKRVSKAGYRLPANQLIDTSYVKQFCELNADKNLYLSISFPKEYFLGITKQLQVEGLTFKYTTTPVNTAQLNYELVEKKWISNLKQFLGSTSTDKLAANYLPALLRAKAYAESKSLEKELQELVQLIEEIAKRTNKTVESTGQNQQ